MRHAALRKEHRIKSGARRRRYGHFKVRDPLCQAEHSQKAECREPQHRTPSDERRKSKDFPAAREIGHYQGRVRVRRSRVRNNASAQKQITGRGNVVACLVPKIGKPKQRSVQQEYRCKDRKQHQRAGRSRSGVSRHKGRIWRQILSRSPRYEVSICTSRCHAQQKGSASKPQPRSHARNPKPQAQVEDSRPEA